MVSSKHPHNLEKLLALAANLVKAHTNAIHKSEKYKLHTDLAFHFVRSLFLENVLENDIVL